MLEIGIEAPAFTLPDQNGVLQCLSDWKGKKIVLYFYSKDNTSGCIKQACGFAELYPHFVEKNAIIVGISKDTVDSHKKFEQKYNLPFTLLSDPELKILKLYDVWKEKKINGKISFGTIRTTYLIDESGFIIQAQEKVKAAQNPENTLAILNSNV